MKQIRRILLLLAALCLTGCQPAETGFTPQYAQAGGYFCFPNTEWGMTEADFYAASGTKASDFNITTSEQVTPAKSANGAEAPEYSVINQTISGSATYWERTMDASLDFMSRPYFSDCALWKITLTDHTCQSEDDFRALCEAVTAWAEEQGVALDIGEIKEGKDAALSCQISSVSTANQLPSDILQGYNRAARHFYFEQSWAQVNGTPVTAETDFAASMDGSASTVLLEWFNDGQTPLAQITFTGRETAMLIAHARDAATLPAEDTTE